MPREFSRSSRLAEQIQRDLSHAKVYVTALAGGDQAAQSIQALQRAAGFLRSRLAQGLTARTVPELHFVYDESVERGIKLSRLIDQAMEASPPEGEKP